MRVFSTMVKEWLLLRRDAGGMLLLLLMPAILVTVMALVQDAPFRDYEALKFDVLAADEDNSPLSQSILEGLRKSNHFNIITESEHQPLTSAMLQRLLLRGDYKTGITLPKGAYAEIVNSANTAANSLAGRLGAGLLPQRAPRSGFQVRLYFDPAAKPAFRSAISFGLDKCITAACTKVLMQRLSALAKSSSDTALTTETPDMEQLFAGIGMKEEIIGQVPSINPVSISSVQHNVPAWSIFGMFFIVVPLAGHLIREREEGSALRTALIPNSRWPVAFGRIVFYMLVCCVQFLLMCAIGIWILPKLGLPPLTFGRHPAALLAVVPAIAFAATCYGYCIGSIFRTTNQALPLGAISIVILAATGGIWVPVELLPHGVQLLALCSPLHWALDGINAIILRNGTVLSTLPMIGALVLFGTVMLLLSHLRSIRNSRLL